MPSVAVPSDPSLPMVPRPAATAPLPQSPGVALLVAPSSDPSLPAVPRPAAAASLPQSPWSEAPTSRIASQLPSPVLAPPVRAPDPDAIVAPIRAPPPAAPLAPLLPGEPSFTASEGGAPDEGAASSPSHLQARSGRPKFSLAAARLPKCTREKAAMILLMAVVLILSLGVWVICLVCFMSGDRGACALYIGPLHRLTEPGTTGWRDATLNVRLLNNFVLVLSTIVALYYGSQVRGWGVGVGGGAWGGVRWAVVEGVA